MNVLNCSSVSVTVSGRMLSRSPPRFLQTASCGSPAGRSYFEAGSWPNGVNVLPPLNPLVWLSPAHAIIDGIIYSHRFSVSDDAPSHTPPFALYDCVPHDRVLQNCTIPYWKRRTVLLSTRDPNLSVSAWTLCGSPARSRKTQKISTRFARTVLCGCLRALWTGRTLPCFLPCRTGCALL